MRSCLPEKREHSHFPLWNPDMSALCAPGSSRTRGNSTRQDTERRPEGQHPPRLVLLICGNYSDRLSLFILPHQELTCVKLPFVATKGDTILLLHAWIIHFPQPRCLFQNLRRLAQCPMGAGENLKSFIFWATENPCHRTTQTTQITEIGG